MFTETKITKLKTLKLQSAKEGTTANEANISHHSQYVNPLTTYIYLKMFFSSWRNYAENTLFKLDLIYLGNAEDAFEYFESSEEEEEEVSSSQENTYKSDKKKGMSLENINSWEKKKYKLLVTPKEDTLEEEESEKLKIMPDFTKPSLNFLFPARPAFIIPNSVID